MVAPIDGLDLSSGARAGLTAFLAGVAREFASRNVTINNILPGKMDTDRFNGTLKMRAEKSGQPIAEAMEKSLSAIPARRLGTKEEFGQLCAFLASNHAGYITGRNFLVDGGLFPGAF